MLNILSVVEEPGQVKFMLKALASKVDVNIVHANSAKFALERVSFQKIDAAIVSEKLPDSSGKDFIESLTKANPFIASAMMSSLEADDFHEETEGLGVLMQLPENPGPSDADALIEKLIKIDKIMMSN